MQRKKDIAHNFWRRFVAWRIRMISSIESLDEYERLPCVPQEKTMVFAVWALAGLLFFGVALLACLWAIS